MEGDPSLAKQCLELCQALTSQGKEFSFTLTISSSFTFSLDTRGRKTPATKVERKKVSPSTLRRNKKRKEEFILKKSSSPVSPEETPRETAEKTSEEEADPRTFKPAEKKQPAPQPWRRPSSCRRCGLPTRGHPGPYGEQRCRVSLHHLPSRVCVMKCSPCMDHPNPPCDNHRKPWTGPGPGMDTG